MRTLTEHLDRACLPKRILALDGGGVRGIFTLQILKRIEQLAGEPLHEHFDLIAGASTGAIIAAALATGRAASEIDALYRDLARDVFDSSPFRRGVLASKFPSGPLRRALDSVLGGATLGGSEIRTGIMLMAKRLDTASPWVFHNHPDGRYFARNRDLRLAQLVRASAAAPSYFRPEPIDLGGGVTGAFVDGGVSPHNNPALQAVLLATLDGYGWRWPLGADCLSVVSVGTGSHQATGVPMTPIAQAIRSLSSLMNDCAALNETMLQWLGHAPKPRTIDREIGEAGSALPKLFRYVRYNAEIPQAIAAMDDPSHLDDLAAAGRLAAGQVEAEDWLANTKALT